MSVINEAFGAVNPHTPPFPFVASRCTCFVPLPRSASAFAAQAKKHSTCPSGQSGGSLGEFGPGQVCVASSRSHALLLCSNRLARMISWQMVPEFDSVIFKTGKVGKLEGPVKTQFGYHLILITQKGDEKM